MVWHVRSARDRLIGQRMCSTTFKSAGRLDLLLTVHVHTIPTSQLAIASRQYFRLVGRTVASAIVYSYVHPFRLHGCMLVHMHAVVRTII